MPITTDIIKFVGETPSILFNGTQIVFNNSCCCDETYPCANCVGALSASGRLSISNMADAGEESCTTCTNFNTYTVDIHHLTYCSYIGERTYFLCNDGDNGLDYYIWGGYIEFTYNAGHYYAIGWVQAGDDMGYVGDYFTYRKDLGTIKPTCSSLNNIELDYIGHDGGTYTWLCDATNSKLKFEFL